MCSTEIVGMCDVCGGIVEIPTIWHGIYPPVPTCRSCGAIADTTSHLPIIPMKPSKFGKWRKTGEGQERNPYVRRPNSWFDEPNVTFDCRKTSLSCSI